LEVVNDDLEYLAKQEENICKLQGRNFNEKHEGE